MEGAAASCVAEEAEAGKAEAVVFLGQCRWSCLHGWPRGPVARRPAATGLPSALLLCASRAGAERRGCGRDPPPAAPGCRLQPGLRAGGGSAQQLPVKGGRLQKRPRSASLGSLVLRYWRSRTGADQSGGALPSAPVTRGLNARGPSGIVHPC